MARGYRFGVVGEQKNNGVLIDGTTVNVTLVDVGTYSHSIDSTKNCVKVTRYGSETGSGVYIYGVQKKNYTKLYVSANMDNSSYRFRLQVGSSSVTIEGTTSKQTRMLDISSITSADFDIRMQVELSTNYSANVYKLWLE